MTTKDAFDNICIYSALHNGVLDNSIELLKKDLEILEILKKHIYFSSKSGCIRMKDIYKSINNFDYEDLREWLENDNK